MNRRKWLQGMFAAAAAGAASGRVAAATSKEVETLQKNWRLLLAEGVRPPSPADKLKLTNDDWRKRLEGMQYNVGSPGTELEFAL